MDWFISDTHFGHGNIMKYCHRPFLKTFEEKMLNEHQDFRVCRESVDLMDQTILDNINSVVKPDDNLWHLGDFCFADYNTARRYRERIDCKNVFLIRGNHDKDFVRGLFTEVHEQLAITVGYQRLFLNHYPMLSWNHSHKGVWMLHGHVHGVIRRNPAIKALYDQMYICDVGVDGPDRDLHEGVYDHTFKPWSVAEISRYMTAKQITKDAPRICSRMGKEAASAMSRYQRLAEEGE